MAVLLVDPAKMKTGSNWFSENTVGICQVTYLPNSRVKIRQGKNSAIRPLQDDTNIKNSAILIVSIDLFCSQIFRFHTMEYIGLI